ncbi:MAG: hypothetical protein RJA70_2769 [Pseudomonadota bacterium]
MHVGVLSVRTLCFCADVEDDLLSAGFKRSPTTRTATGQAIGFDSSKALGDRPRGCSGNHPCKPWVMGERLSVCDYYLFTIARWLEVDGVDLAKLPRVVEHRARVTALPLAQRVLAQYESNKPRSPL